MFDFLSAFEHFTPAFLLRVDTNNGDVLLRARAFHKSKTTIANNKEKWQWTENISQYLRQLREEKKFIKYK